MNPTEEGRKAFMDKLPEDACPYEGGKAEIEWKLGYAKQEYEELKEEQASLLDSISWHSDPYTGLEGLIRKIQSSIEQYQDDLSRIGNFS